MRGNTGNAPLKVLDPDALAAGGKRWRFASLKTRLHTTSARPASLPAIQFSSNIQPEKLLHPSSSHFAAILASEASANITASFQLFYNHVEPLSISLPLVFRNRNNLIQACLDALERSTHHEAEATMSIANCLSAIFVDIGPQHLHPLFPRIITSFATVFNNTVLASNQTSASILWDPSNSLIPLFASLAEIARLAIQTLTTHPHHTVLSLLPLLSHSHYRIREMTAESCLGYIIRKTRDEQHLKRLTTTVVSAATSTTLNANNRKCAANGLGISLFEAIRLPSGRLHSRATVVVIAALESLPTHCEPVNSEPANAAPADDAHMFDPCLSVLSTCFANLCRHVTNEKDAKAITATFVTFGEMFLSNAQIVPLTKLIFLLRNWLRYGGKNVSELLGLPFLQRILSFLSTSARDCVNHSRVVFECLAAICSVSSHAPSAFRQKVCRTTISPVLENIAESIEQQSMRAALYVLLDVYRDEWDVSRLLVLQQSVGHLCDKIALGDCQTDSDSRDSKSSKISIPALCSALSFIRLHDQLSEPQTLGVVKLECPTLGAGVLTVLRTHSERDADWMTDGSSDEENHTLALVLRYLSRVIVPDSMGLLCNAVSDKKLCVEWKARFLRAACFQYLNTDSDSEKFLEVQVVASVVNLISNVKETTAFLDVLQALDFFFRVSRNNVTVRKELNQNDIERFRGILVHNLCSPDQNVRILCAANLANVCSLDSETTGRESLLLGSQDPEQVLALGLERIQNAFQVGGVHLESFFRVMQYVFETSRVMSAISTKQKFVQDIARLVQNCRKVREDLLSAVVHFGLGVLRTPIRLLWRDARSLLKFAADREQKLAMSILVTQLLASKADIIHYCRKRQTEFEEYLEIENESGEGEAEIIQSAAEPNVPVKRDRENRSPKPNCKRGSKRRRQAVSPESCVRKRKPSDVRAISKAWDEKFLTSDVLLERFRETSVFRVDLLRQETTGIHESTTDTPTFIVELARCLHEEPRYCMKYRIDIISVYLGLDTSLFSQKRGTHIALAFTDLMESVGGLKSCETDIALENRMRSRLLSDLTIPNCELQAAVLRCLCVSRSPWIKPYRDSLIRLTQSKSFREELALITEGIFSKSEEEVNASDEKELIVDLLTRICFSKLRGKWSKKGSQRAAVLSFLSSKLPWDIAFPKLISLVLKPLLHVVEVLEKDMSMDTSALTMPNVVVQQAILGSIEAIVRQCRMSLPSSSWKRLAIATVIVMRNAGIGHQGQSMRSRSLRVCSEMHRIRPRETAFCIAAVMQALGDANFSTETGRAIQKTPALMQFVGTVMGSDAMHGKEDLIREHSWAIEYCFNVLKEKKVEADAVDVGLVVAKGFLTFCNSLSFADPTLASVLNSNIKHLLQSLSAALQTLVLRLIGGVENGRKALKSSVRTFSNALEVLEILAGFEQMDTCMLVSVADAISTSLVSVDWNAPSTSVSLRALSTIALRIKKGGGSEERKIQESILRLIPQISQSRFTSAPQTFGALCDLLSNANLPDLVAACRVLRSMYAMISTKLDTPDLDKRIEALNELNEMVKGGFSAGNITIAIKNNKKDVGEAVLGENATEGLISCGPDALIALFCGAFAAVRCEDTAVRGNAGYAISLLAKWAARPDCSSTKKLKTHIFESLIHGTVTSRDGICRREYCRALGEFVRCTVVSREDHEEDGLLILPIMKKLSSVADVDVDVFENLVHLQAHRRGKAVRDLEKCISLFRESQSENTEKKMVTRYEAFAKSFCLPLALIMSLELAGDSEPQNRSRFMKGVQSKESSRRDVALWAVSLTGESARLLPWEDYKTCLTGILKRLRSETRAEVSGMLFKLLVKISEAFPQYEHESDEYVKTSTYLAEFVLPRMLQCVTAGSVEGNVVKDSNNHPDHRNRASTLVFQAPVAVAIAQLMVRLPPAKLDSIISLLITPMTNALRSRMSGIRDSAKKALTSVVLILGSKYLGYVLQQVLSGLGEGYRRDSCVYIIYSVLSGVVVEKRLGTERYSLDSVYDILAGFLLEELNVGIDESRREYEDPNASTARKRQSTFRAMKACECTQIIAENITFRDHGEAFCKPYVDLLANCSSSKLFNRMQECWRLIILGFSKNSTMHVEDSFILCYKLMCWETKQRTLKAADTDSAKDFGEAAQKVASSSNTYKIAKLGMQFLSSILARNCPNIKEHTAKSRKIHAMCEPFIPFVIKASNYGRDDLTLVAFKVAQRLLKLPLPGRIEMGRSLSDTIVNVLSYGSNAIGNAGVVETEDNLFITCLRSASLLFSEVGTRDFTVVSRERVEAIISISCECIESGGPEVRLAALSVLRSLVVNQAVIPALYEAIEKVNHMAIHSQSRQLRDACTNLSVTFLVSFPLGSKRVRQNLEFFVRNLSYDLPAGRLAALNAIQAVLNKFPGPVLERESEYLFLALSSIVSRDIDSDCRSNASRCLQLLFERLPDGRKISDLLRMAITLSGLVPCGEDSNFENTYNETDPIIQRSGAASLASACVSGRLNADQLCLVVRTAAAVLPNLSTENGWEATHSFLLCVEEALAKSSLKGKKQLEVQPYAFPIWNMLPSLLLCHHQWVRLSAARLLGRHLSAAGKGQEIVNNLSRSSMIWSSNDLVRQLLRSSCLQLEANILAPELAKLTLENLLCMADVIRVNPKVGDLGKTSSMNASTAETEIDLEEGRALHWLIARVSGIATKGKLEDADILRRGCALRFLLVSTKRWDRETIGRHAQQYIQPVMKILESGDTRMLSMTAFEAKASDEQKKQKLEGTGASGSALDGIETAGGGLRLLAQTLQESLAEVLGTSKYFEIYNELRSRRTEIKQTRKRNAAVLAAADPERTAKKRRKKAESRRRQKKRYLPSNTSNSALTKKLSLTEDL
ncbi:unnamed protein product [Agarophyton chilense]